MINMVLNTALAFLVLFAVFTLLERLFLNRVQSVFRREWATDLAFFVGQYLLWGGIIYIALNSLSANLHWLTNDFRPWFQTQPFWLQVLEVVLFGDFLVYWGHRLSHKVEFLWRFHRVHHTAEKLDWLAAHREHPLDGLYTQFWMNLPAIVAGFSFDAVAGLIAFRSVWGIFIHSNIDLRLGPLKWFLGAPELHHWHHDRDRNSQVNFANLMPLMDILFGTYYATKTKPGAYGIDENIAHGYFQQLIQPFRRRIVAAPATRVDRNGRQAVYYKHQIRKNQS